MPGCLACGWFLTRPLRIATNPAGSARAKGRKRRQLRLTGARGAETNAMSINQSHLLVQMAGSVSRTVTAARRPESRSSGGFGR
jgi:hypothetical protein